MEKIENALALSIEEAGRRMNLSRCSMYKLARAEGFPSVRVGGRIVIPIRELEAWLADQAKKGATRGDTI